MNVIARQRLKAEPKQSQVQGLLCSLRLLAMTHGGDYEA